MSYTDPIKAPVRTRYARKYGNKRYMNATTNRSLFSPINAYYPKYQANEFEDTYTDNEKAKIKFDEVRQDQQRKKLFGYTTRELTDLGCITTRSLKIPDLGGPIIPFLNKDHWEQSPNLDQDWVQEGREFYPIDPKNPSKGVWAVSNPIVWEHLQPALMLASKILGDVHTIAFVQSLFTGTEELIPDERISPGDRKKYQNPNKHKGPHLYNISARQMLRRSEQPQITKKINDIYQCLEQRLNLGFMKSGEDPRDGDSDFEESYGLALSHQHIDFGSKLGKPFDDADCTKFWIWIEYDNLMAPLLRDDLDDSERLTLYWHTALTLVHEVMHSMWMVHKFFENPKRYIDMSLDQDFPWVEPYYDGSPISELGWQMQQAVYGGHEEAFLKDLKGGPLGFWYLSVWPTVMDIGDSHGKGEQSACPTLLTPELAEFQTRYPIPVSYYEEMFQENFWVAGFQNFGIQALHVRNLRNGVKTFYKKYSVDYGAEGFMDEWKTDPEYKHIRERPWKYADLDTVQLPWDDLLTLTPAERTAFNYNTLLVLTARLQYDYQATLAKAEDEIGKIMKNAADMPGFASDPKRSNLCASIVVGLSIAINEHYHTVLDLIVMERNSNVPRPDWRHNLLNWNRGVRNFVTSLEKNVAEPLLRNQLPSLAASLEASRMHIWSQGPNHCDGDDRWEVEKLTDAAMALQRGKDEVFERAILELMNKQGLSKYARASTSLLLGGWSQRFTKYQRLGHLNAALNGLRLIKDTIQSVPPPWQERFSTDWFRALYLIRSTENEPDPVLPGLGSGIPVGQ